MRRVSLRSRAVHREAPAQLDHLRAHALDRRRGALRIEHLRDEVDHLLDLGLA